MRCHKSFAVTVFILFAFFISQAMAVVNIAPQWAESVTTGADISDFSSVAVDVSGNIYAVGLITGTGNYDFGNSVTIKGQRPNDIVLVKYDNTGKTQWARSVVTGPDSSVFNSVAVDASGNIYVVGAIYGSQPFDFGNGVTINGNYSGSMNSVLVKYDSSGKAQWARSTSSGLASTFSSIRLDASGNIYVAGVIYGTNSFNFSGATVSGSYPTGYNGVLVKYDSNGNGKWARSVNGPNYSQLLQ